MSKSEGWNRKNEAEELDEEMADQEKIIFPTIENKVMFI